ncbi:MAG TPA: hypothetical protein VMF51_18365 [Nocardioides sp.]|uniref:hypothetical protein n=1 Tax=Nocardioides sp. TaxID=35761 RepID=UPI002D039973|nr:hypothetical protein [Nocardioides sp.]HTW17101.1 hypothetical protein [Nocardioides sp.]
MSWLSRRREQRAERAAAAIWAAYRAAVEANDQSAYDVAMKAAEAWVRKHHPDAVEFSLDRLVDGKPGITIHTRHNDLDWLVWTPNEAG